MTRPTVLDMDLVVVPREATGEMMDAYRAGETRKRLDILSPWPTEETEAGGGSLGYGLRSALSASPYPTAWDDVRKYVEGLEAENKEFRAGIKRLSDEEELCGETMPDEDAFNLVRMAARLSAAEARNQKIMSSLNNVVMLGEAGHYVNDAIFDALQSRAHRAEAAEVRVAELEKRLADAERVIEPFAKASDEADALAGHDGPTGQFVDLPPLRAARAYLEGK